MNVFSWIRKMFARKPTQQAARGNLLPGERARNYTGDTAQQQAWRGVSAKMGEQPRSSEFGRLLRK